MREQIAHAFPIPRRATAIQGRQVFVYGYRLAHPQQNVPR